MITLTLSLGAHWACLQSVAWVGMIINYSREASFAEAVSMTFDGKHPCRLCKAIQAGRNQEKKQDQQQSQSSSKLELGLVWRPVGFDFFCDRERIASTDSFAQSRSEEPPKPRPRSRPFCNPA